MAKHLPAQTVETARSLPVRVIHYVDPAARPTSAQLANLSPAELLVALGAAAAQQQHRAVEHRARYDAWLQRRAETARHDRKVRRVALVAVPVVLVLLAAGGWLLAQLAVAAVSAGAVLGGVAVLAVLGVTVGAVGRRCITVVQHWHE